MAVIISFKLLFSWCVMYDVFVFILWCQIEVSFNSVFILKIIYIWWKIFYVNSSRRCLQNSPENRRYLPVYSSCQCNILLNLWVDIFVLSKNLNMKIKLKSLFLTLEIENHMQSFHQLLSSKISICQLHVHVYVDSTRTYLFPGYCRV